MKRRLLSLGFLVALTLCLVWWFWPPKDLTPSTNLTPIESAWLEVVPSIADLPDRVVSPSQEKLERFIGFLEHEATVGVPQWWRAALMDAHWGPGGSFFFHRDKGFEYQSSMEHLKTPLGTTLAKEDGKFILCIGEDSITLPDGVVGSRLKGEMSEVPFDNYSALFTPTRCYVAAYRDIATDFPLYCIDRSTGKPLWKREIKWRGVDGSLVYTSVWVSIVEKGNRVIVFCLGTHCGLRVEG